MPLSKKRPLYSVIYFAQPLLALLLLLTTFFPWYSYTDFDTKEVFTTTPWHPAHGHEYGEKIPFWEHAFGITLFIIIIIFISQLIVLLRKWSGESGNNRFLTFSSLLILLASGLNTVLLPLLIKHPPYGCCMSPAVDKFEIGIYLALIPTALLVITSAVLLYLLKKKKDPT